MEKMTDEMSKIARETKTETVSMKIITLVTLFFLPGTFIAVSPFLFFWLASMCVFWSSALHLHYTLMNYSHSSLILRT